MRSDLIGAPVVFGEDEAIYVIRAVWNDYDPTSGGRPRMTLFALIENEQGGLVVVEATQIRMLVPQVMSSHSASFITELFPDLLMGFGRREIVAIWTLGLGFDGPLRERIKYGIVAFKEGKEGELAAFRAARDAGAPEPWGAEPPSPGLKTEPGAGPAPEPWHPGTESGDANQ
jgi:hypothetical protein